ncbi:MAG: nucleotide kinase domain-containing protein [Bacteroidota bacterium]
MNAIKLNNPYATALDGLVIEDPVHAFFDWCKEREQIRIRRESGHPPPWTDDPVFQQGRFLNVFREDDKGSRAVVQFCQAVKDQRSDLVHALFFARWCNHHLTLNMIGAEMLTHPLALQARLRDLGDQWCSEVYPVVPLQWEGKSYDRFTACTELFPQIVPFLLEAIQTADGNVVTATETINATFQMENDFPIFMALIDVSWFFPDLIRPDSPVPSGIGAIPYLDRLQHHLGCADHHEVAEKMIAKQATLWPEAKRSFTPVDIEYLSCECRKYFSYLNGTKRFEGRNLFIPRT